MSTQDRLSEQNRDVEALQYLEGQVLMPGEKVAWKGRPGASASAKVGMFKAAFGVFFFGFSLVWTYLALTMGGGMFALFGIPFIAVGFWMVSGPARNYFRSARTYYAITDKRVIILTGGKGYTINAITPDQMSDYQRTDHGDGSGDIRLRLTVHHGKNGQTTSTEYADGLWGIQDVKGAAEAIGNLRTA